MLSCVQRTRKFMCFLCKDDVYLYVHVICLLHTKTKGNLHNKNITTVNREIFMWKLFMW